MSEVAKANNHKNVNMRQRVGDRAMSVLLKLPRASGEYTVAKDVPIVARDGVTLLADHYAPVGQSRGTVLVRTPYGCDQMQTAIYARPYAARGYHVVLARCRGTFGSGGAWEPMVHEVDDAVDTVDWLRQQSWFGGRFATLGASYLGFTQWALLQNPPPELAAVIVQVGPHDFATAAYQGGAFALNDMLGWGEIVAHQEDHGLARGVLRAATVARRLKEYLRSLPIASVGARLLGASGEWYRKWVGTRNLSDAYWSTMRLSDSLDRVQVPVLIHTGWQDIFLQQAMTQYRHLVGRGLDVAMTVGPWEHLDIEAKAAPKLMAECLDWLSFHLDGAEITRPSPVEVFVTGVDRWKGYSLWPPRTTEHCLYPLTGGRLGDRSADADGPLSFTYDPADPTPSVGGRLMFTHGGYKDDTSLTRRNDVLTFTGPAVESPLEIAGTAIVQLAHSSDNPHADVFVRVSDVDPKGKARNITEGFMRLDPDSILPLVRIELDAAAHVFLPGHHIRLIVAGGSHPRFERNLGTGADPATSTEMVASRRSLDLTRSRLVLPIIS